VARGLLLSPSSSLIRVLGEGALAVHQRAPAFGLQWHLTNACDLDCRHCYDRSPREVLGEREVVRVLDDLRAFCRDRFVAGDVTFTGGNPFLHPRFWSIYEAAWDRGLTPSILGNPISAADVRRLVAIAPPTFFQVSLDGLEARHDAVRGSGQFQRVLRFLALLKVHGVPSSVMMTVSADNLDDVIPLAELLRERTGCFSFSRLSRAGRGASLAGPSREAYRKLLERCVEVEAGYPELHAKDGLANLVRHRLGRPLDAGCSEFGCCAAFTFLAVLPDGEVHACRKYPSPVGHIGRQRIAEIFEGPAARRHRSGCAGCRGCPVEPVCGGCAAATHGSGLDPAFRRDPWCFS
jgi:selenobiotic family peptide radical SAM maturase